MGSKRKIVYICNYDDHNNNYDLLTQPSGVTKINYILSALKGVGCTVDIITTAVSKSSIVIHDNIKETDFGTIRFLTSFGRSSLIRKSLSKLCVYLQVLWILLTIKRNSNVLIYHSLPLTNVVKMAQRFNKFRLFIEVEEIFSVLRHKDEAQVANEVMSVRNAVGYILVNDHIKTLCNLRGPSAVCYGNYNSSYPPRRFDSNDVVNILYAGGLDADAELAIRTVKMLPDRYVLHVLGYGTQDQMKHVMELCKSSDRITYHGCLNGREYDDFISKCQIGLCSRAVETKESLYAFPSKILAYLSHNLITVSTPLPAVVKSSVVDYIYFSEDYTEEALAQSILKATAESRVIDNMSVTLSLDTQFKDELLKIFYTTELK